MYMSKEIEKTERNNDKNLKFLLHNDEILQFRIGRNNSEHDIRKISRDYQDIATLNVHNSISKSMMNFLLMKCLVKLSMSTILTTVIE